MRAKVHQPFVYLTVFYAAGILLTKWLSFRVEAYLPVLAVCFIAVLFNFNRKIGGALILMLFLLLGALSSSLRQYMTETPLQKTVRYNYGKQVEIVGRVSSDVRTRFVNHAVKQDFMLKVFEVNDAYRPRKAGGIVLVQLFNDHAVRYGDVILLEGRLHRPFEFDKDSNSSYRSYLYNRGIKWIFSVKKKAKVQVLERGRGNPVKRVALKLRHKGEKILHQHLSNNEAGIMQAVLLGNRSGLSRHIRGLFVQTGTAHILAISGLHVGVITAILMVLIKLFPFQRKVQYLIVILLLTGYVFMTGARPSILRATVMAVIFLASYIFERNQSSYNTLGVAALGLLFYNPFYLYDVGFQLSFSCVISIIFVSRHLRIKIPHKIGQRLVDSFSISAGIWFAISPLIAYYFLIITPITIIANLMIIPLLTLIVGCGFGLIVFGGVLPAVAGTFGVCTRIILNAMVGIISLLNECPGAYFYLKTVKLWQITVYYAFLVAVFVIFARSRIRKSKKIVLSNGRARR